MPSSSVSDGNAGSTVTRVRVVFSTRTYRRKVLLGRAPAEASDTSFRFRFFASGALVSVASLDADAAELEFDVRFFEAGAATGTGGADEVAGAAWEGAASPAAEELALFEEDDEGETTA